mmetsp:Transcript_13088/g.38328  ORF Transcript_13088/g.38328 Transcript_13088/m.38328 type:complete len:443 (-) Transcript_13088:22-1350(-)
MHYCLSIPTPEPLPSPIHGRVPTRGAGPRGAREAAAAPEPQPHPHGVHPLPHGVGPPPRRLLELANDLRQPSRRRVKVAWRARLGAGRGDTSRASRARVAGQVSEVKDDAPRVASLAQLPLPPRQLLGGVDVAKPLDLGEGGVLQQPKVLDGRSQVEVGVHVARLVALPLGRDKGQLRRDGRHRRHVARRLLAGDPRAQPAEEEGEAAQRGAVVGREEGRLGAHVDGDDGRRAELPAHHVGGQVIDVAAVAEQMHDLSAVLVDNRVADGWQVARERHRRAHVLPHRPVAVDDGRGRVQVGRDAKHRRHQVLDLSRPQRVDDEAVEPLARKVGGDWQGQVAHEAPGGGHAGREVAHHAPHRGEGADRVEWIVVERPDGGDEGALRRAADLVDRDARLPHRSQYAEVREAARAPAAEDEPKRHSGERARQPVHVREVVLRLEGS